MQLQPSVGTRMRSSYFNLLPVAPKVEVAIEQTRDTENLNLFVVKYVALSQDHTGRPAEGLHVSKMEKSDKNPLYLL